MASVTAGDRIAQAESILPIPRPTIRICGAGQESAEATDTRDEGNPACKEELYINLLCPVFALPLVVVAIRFSWAFLPD